MCGIFDSELRDFLADDFFLDAFWLVLLGDVGIFIYLGKIYLCAFLLEPKVQGVHDDLSRGLLEPKIQGVNDDFVPQKPQRTELLQSSQVTTERCHRTPFLQQIRDLHQATLDVAFE